MITEERSETQGLGSLGGGQPQPGFPCTAQLGLSQAVHRRLQPAVMCCGDGMMMMVTSQVDIMMM